MTLDPQRKRALLEAKLGALVRNTAAGAPLVFRPFAPGAAGWQDGEVWVLAEGEHEARCLGPALAWGRQEGATVTNVVAHSAAGLLARRAAAFVTPVRVWSVGGRALAPASPEPLPIDLPLDDRVEPLIGLIRAAGADPVVEHGVLTGEVAGLEVCRAVVDPTLGCARLEVGIGAHDREAFRVVHGDVPPLEALAEVVAKVAPHRAPGAAPHPLNRLAPERLLRHRLVGQPGLVGAVRLEAAPPPVARGGLGPRATVPCVAEGTDERGRRLVVVCSVGIDLDVVPFTVDARLAAAADEAAGLIALPDRDVHPVTLALNAALQVPVTVVGLPPA